jgi:hypothetical protein
VEEEHCEVRLYSWVYFCRKIDDDTYDIWHKSRDHDIRGDQNRFPFSERTNISYKKRIVLKRIKNLSRDGKMDAISIREIASLTHLVKQLEPHEILELYIHEGRCLKWEKKKRWMSYLTLGISNVFTSPVVVVIMDNCPSSYNVVSKVKDSSSLEGGRVRWMIDYLKEEENGETWWPMESWDFIDVSSIVPFRSLLDATFSLNDEASFLSHAETKFSLHTQESFPPEIEESYPSDI